MTDKDIILEAELSNWEQPRKPQSNALLIMILLWIAAMFLTKFSYFSSAADYLTTLRRTDVAGDRVLGLQLAILTFWSVATLFAIQAIHSSGWRRIGCIVGVLASMALGSLQSLDSFVTSLGYQIHQLGKLTSPDRDLEASVKRMETDLKTADDRFSDQFKQLQRDRVNSQAELEKLDQILAPAIESGTNLKKSYSDQRSALAAEISDIDQKFAQAQSGLVSYKQDLYKKIATEKQQLAALNSSGVSRASKFVGISPETNIALKTLCCELALIALAVMTALGGSSLTTAQSREGRMMAGGRLALQLVTIAATFYFAHQQFLSEAPSIMEDLGEETAEPFSPAVPVLPARGVDPALFQDPDSLPQWESSANFGESGTMMHLVMMHQEDYPQCEIPKDVWSFLNGLKISAKDKAIFAATAWKESSYNPKCSHYDNDGGYSHGLFQLHGRWRKADVDWMKSQKGGWQDIGNNYQALLRTFADHAEYWDCSTWRLTLARYNGGGHPNWRYADSILAKAEKLEKYFTEGETA